MILEELRAHVLQTALLLPKYGLVWMAGGTVARAIRKPDISSSHPADWTTNALRQRI